MKPYVCSLAILTSLGCTQPLATEPQPPAATSAPYRSAEPVRAPVHGKADVLRDVPKKFATYLGVDAATGTVTLRVEGEPEPTSWSLLPDAEIKVHGWWGRLDQLRVGDRVWAWFAIDRQKIPTAILFLSDEVSEQDLHNLPSTVETFDAERRTVTVRSSRGDRRTLHLANTLHITGTGENFLISRDGQPPFHGKPGDPAFVQSAGTTLRLLLSPESLGRAREAQKATLRERWRTNGLPGTVTFLHPLAGEMEIMLDHEAMRWGRYLRRADEVTVNTAEPLEAVVKHVRPWRERTQLRLVTASGRDQADLALGQRVRILVPEPPADVRSSDLPTDLGRSRTRDERIEWFLATVYCPCSIAKDQCTGMVYTQASCSVTACGMPNRIKSEIGELIDRDLGDEAILRQLRERHGPLVHKQHLLQ